MAGSGVPRSVARVRATNACVGGIGGDKSENDDVYSNSLGRSRGFSMLLLRERECRVLILISSSGMFSRPAESTDDVSRPKFTRA